eukprot:NODE_65_length_25825_cov_1.353844.p3 type:complete len:975 gc:universal NODE_65_length_25825_cov_1.353844:9489-6565(-)
MNSSSTQLRRGLSRKTATRDNQKMTLSRKMIGNHDKMDDSSKWAAIARTLTCCISGSCLSIFKMRDKGTQQAWREKVALCIIFSICSAILVWLTLYLQPTLCPESDNANVIDSKTATPNSGKFAVKGLWLDPNSIGIKLSSADRTSASSKVDGPKLMSTLFPQCEETKGDLKALSDPPLSKTAIDISDKLDEGIFTYGSSDFLRLTIPWKELQNNKFFDADAKLMVLNGNILRMDDYLNSKRDDSELDHAIEMFSTNSGNIAAKDGTKYFSDRESLRPNIDCMVALYRVAFVEKFSLRCGLANIILGTGLVIITLIVFMRFFMALLFAWVLEPRLVASGRKYDPLTVLLVTCYSEGKEGLKTTLESLANTTYPDSKKVIFIVADGLVVGDGKPLTTPDIALSLLEISEKHINPNPKSYIAVAQGSKQHNQAKVYPGFYNSDSGRKIPTILIVKCGTEDEANAAKPGNRGKRDSQILLMSFFSRIFFNERVTPFDYDLFRKIRSLIGVTAEQFEIILMVDADTFVLPDSVEKLINAVMKDDRIMGLCGETRISNKKESWITSIQVFEYFISHHLGKAFESVFGGVTCLPGCFCMYRIKSRKVVDGKEAWVPILANKDVVDQYSTNQTNTLHEKNLLLLGEDRFLTTLMLKQFPTRKLVFVPSAKCRTEVPNSYKVLNSQRRRWINSTIHNLFELMLVNELCGVFCCSMRFVVFLDLIGTITLPAAICLTYYTVYGFVIDILYGTLGPFASYIPMIALVLILFSPAILIMLTTFKLVYVAWMFFYLIIGLPVWNFFLPIYAWIHFDDFSWGQTRQVAGEVKGESHASGEGKFNVKEIPMRRITEWIKKGNRKSQTTTAFPSNESPLRGAEAIPISRASEHFSSNIDDLELYFQDNQYYHQTSHQGSAQNNRHSFHYRDQFQRQPQHFQQYPNQESYYANTANIQDDEDQPYQFSHPHDNFPNSMKQHHRSRSHHFG